MSDSSSSSPSSSKKRRSHGTPSVSSASSPSSSSRWSSRDSDVYSLPDLVQSGTIVHSHSSASFASAFNTLDVNSQVDDPIRGNFSPRVGTAAAFDEAAAPPVGPPQMDQFQSNPYQSSGVATDTSPFIDHRLLADPFSLSFSGDDDRLQLGLWADLHVGIAPPPNEHTAAFGSSLQVNPPPEYNSLNSHATFIPDEEEEDDDLMSTFGQGADPNDDGRAADQKKSH